MKSFTVVAMISAMVLLQDHALSAPRPLISSLVDSGANMLKNQVTQSADVAGKTLNIGKDLTQLATNLAGKGTYMGTTVGKVGVNQFAGLGDEVISNGVDLGNSILDIASSVAGSSPIPILGEYLQMAPNLGKEALDMSASVASNLLDLASNSALTTLTGVNSAGQLTSGTIGGLAGLGFGAGQRGVEASADAVNNGIDKLTSLLKRPAVGGLPDVQSPSNGSFLGRVTSIFG